MPHARYSDEHWTALRAAIEVLARRDEGIVLANGDVKMLDGRLGELDRLIDAYIHESPRPDCAPTMRFRAVLAIGMDKWCSTREEARAAVRRAAGLGEE